MNELIQFLRSNIVLIAGFLSAIGVIWKTCGVPIKGLVDKINDIDEDTADLLWDRLSQAHTYFVGRGWASDADKERICLMHQRYKAKGRNHLAETFEQDILRLPSQPPANNGGNVQ